MYFEISTGEQNLHTLGLLVDGTNGQDHEVEHFALQKGTRIYDLWPVILLLTLQTTRTTNSTTSTSSFGGRGRGQREAFELFGPIDEPSGDAQRNMPD